MKTRIQLIPELLIAIVCASLWFALWLSMVHPLPQLSVRPSIKPQTAYLPAIDETFRTLRSPTLFALPSESGFSGIFPARYATAELSLEAPRQKEFELSREAVRMPPPSTRTLDPVPLLQESLPHPATGPQVANPPLPQQTAFYFSRELQHRLAQPPQLDIDGPLPDTVNVSMTVLADGRVGQLFFETPVQNASLAGALRKIKFRPAAGSTSGQLEIRFVPEGSL